LPRKWCARTGIEQKMSESVPGDSRRTSLPTGNFYAIVRADLISRRIFLFTRAQARRKLPHCTQNGFPHARTVARVRVRVSFSGFR
jgi:hypothetical protein